MNILLFGFKKCGKTYFGMKLAKKLHREFIESDCLIEEVYAAKHSPPLSYRDIAKKHGFAFFQELEKHAVSLILQKRHCVFSLGGSVVLDPENVIRLKQVGILVYIKAPKDLLKTRILSGEIPPYLDSKHPSESFEEFYKERMPLYEKVGAYSVEIEGKTEAEILHELHELTKKHKGSLPS